VQKGNSFFLAWRKMEIDADLNKVQKAIMKLFRQHPAGITIETISSELVDTKDTEIVGSINELLKMGAIAIFKEPGVGLMYKEADPEDFKKFKGLSSEERLIYQLIESSSNKGIWTKDLKAKSNCQQAQIAKILKTLEGKKLVKCVKSIASKNKKVYMLYDLEPHVDVTGDVWFSESRELDVEFIAIVTKHCLGLIQAKGYASAEEVTGAVRKSGLSKVELRVENIQEVLDALIYDGKIEPVEDPRGPAFLGGKRATLYKPTKVDTVPNGFTSTPCGVCPVFRECFEGGEISPITCVYLKEWLD